MAYVPQSPPTATDIARARLGDLTTPYLLEDWVYDLILGGSVDNEKLATLAEAIGTALAQSSGLRLTLGDQTLQETTGDRAQRYFDLAKTLRARPDGDGASDAGCMPSSCYLPF